MKRILKQIFHLTFSKLIITASNLIVIILCSHYLTVEDYATYRQAFLPYETLIPIILLGIPSALYYLLPKEKLQTSLVINSIIVVIATNSFLFVLTFIIGNEKISEFFNNKSIENIIYIIIAYSFAQSITQILTTVFIFNNKSKYIASLTSISSILSVITSILLLILKFSYYEIIITKTVFSFFNASVLLLSFLYIEKNNIKKLTINYNKIFYIIYSSLPIGIASSLSAISMNIDKIIVSTVANTNEYGIYINGATEIPLVSILTGSIASILVSEMAKEIQNNNKEKALEYFKLSANKTALILFPLTIFFAFFSKEFITTIFSDSYEKSSITFLIYLCLLPARIVVFGSALIALGKGNCILKRVIIEIFFNITLSYLLLRIYGIYGVAYATVIITYAWSIPYNIYEISKGFRTSIFNVIDLNELFRILLISIILSPVLFFTKNLEVANILKMIIAFVLYASMFTIIFHKKFFKTQYI